MNEEEEMVENREANDEVRDGQAEDQLVRFHMAETTAQPYRQDCQDVAQDDDDQYYHVDDDPAEVAERRRYRAGI